jgi:hypothetical protein
VIARHGAKDLAAREGLAGIQGALAELIDKVPGVAPGAAVEGGPGAGSDAGADDAPGGAQDGPR